MTGLFAARRAQQLPFFACPGGQKPLPGPPCCAATTPASGTYTAQPPSIAAPSDRMRRIFFMVCSGGGSAPMLPGQKLKLTPVWLPAETFTALLCVTPDALVACTEYCPATADTTDSAIGSVAL